MELEERFNSVYFSSNLEYILDTYGNSSELSNMFVRNFFWSFHSDKNHEEMDKTEIREEMLFLMEASEAKIHEREIDLLLDYFNLIYCEKDKSDNNGQAILLVPNAKIDGDEYFKALYQQDKLKLPVETIIDLRKREIVNYGSVVPENIIALTPNSDKVLTLCRNKK